MYSEWWFELWKNLIAVVAVLWLLKRAEQVELLRF